MLGGDGDDRFEPRAGDDVVLGGEGSDTASYTDAPSGVLVTLVDNPGATSPLHDTVEFLVTSTGIGADTLVGVETVRTGNKADRLTLSSFEGFDTTDGLLVDLGTNPVAGQSGLWAESADVVDLSTVGHGVSADFSDPSGQWVEKPGGARMNLANVEGIEGTGFDDRVWGGTVLKYADLGAGDDTLDGAGTQAAIYGGAGDDILRVSDGEGAFLHGGAGEDTLIGEGGEDHLWGGDGSGSDDGATDWFGVTHGTFVEDAQANDRVVWGPFLLTGGVQQWWMEGGYAYWTPFSSIVATLGHASLIGGAINTAMSFVMDTQFMASVRYAQTESGQLVIQMARGRGGQAVIEDYSLGLDQGTATGNIAVFRQTFVDAAGAVLQSYKTFLNFALKAGFGVCFQGTDPLVIDLDRDGIELTREAYGGVYFDVDADGFAEHTGWVAPDDGLLARDLNSNGKIDDQGELFGDAATDGFAALASLDSNSDDLIDASDTAFATLRVWRDLDQDGVTDAGELLTLTQAGIASISLSTSTPTTSAIVGNQIRAEATVTFTGGLTSTVADVVLASDQTDSRWLGDDSVSAAAAALPNLRGYGDMPGLAIAMTDDATLLGLVDDFAGLPATTSWSDLKAAAEDILFRWAGVDGTAPTAMTSEFDRQKLAFLEKYLGYEMTPRDGGGNPSLANVEELVAAWEDVLEKVTLRLAAQGPLVAALGALDYDAAADRFQALSATTLAGVFETALADLPSGHAAALSEWSESSGPMLSAFMDALVRHDGNEIRGDFAVGSLVRALAATSSPLSLTELATGLGLANVFEGTAGANSLSRGSAAGLATFVGAAGNDTLTGGAGQDVYVFGAGFGQDTVNDSESAGMESGDRLRLVSLDADDVTIERVGLDLVITVNGTTDKITVKNQFEYDPPSLAWDMLARMNHYPSLVQVFCKSVIETAGGQSRQLGEGPRWRLGREVLFEGRSAQANAEEIRKRFQWTLDLDPRYDLIAKCIALYRFDNVEGHAAVLRRGLTVQEIEDLVADWWPREIERPRPRDLEELLNEMVDLGVLGRLEGRRCGLRNAHIAQLLGQREKIEADILALSEREADVDYDAGTFHRRVRTANATPRSPLPDRLLGQLFDRGTPGVRIVAGTTSVVGPGIASRIVMLAENWAHETERTSKVKRHQGSPAALRALIERPKDGHHFIVIEAPWDSRVADWLACQKAVGEGRIVPIWIVSAGWSAGTSLDADGLRVFRAGPWSESMLRHWMREEGFDTLDERSTREAILSVSGGAPERLADMRPLLQELTNDPPERRSQRLAEWGELNRVQAEDVGLPESLVPLFSDFAAYGEVNDRADLDELFGDQAARLAEVATSLGLVEPTGRSGLRLTPFGRLIAV